MPRLPSITARRLVRALRRAGFVDDRQKGSHLVLLHPGTKARTVVPLHAGKTLKHPLLRAILHDAGLTVEQFLDLL